MLYLFFLILFVSKNVIFVSREMDSYLVWQIKWCANGWLLCGAVGACISLGTLEVWGWWLFCLFSCSADSQTGGFWSIFSLQCIAAEFILISRNWGNNSVNILLFMLSLVWSHLPDLKLSCLQLQIMNKSLLSLVSAHHKAKPQLALFSGLVGNLTPSHPEMRVWVLCPSITVRPHLWEALVGGGPNLPCPSPKDPCPWIIASRFISLIKYLSCCSKLEVMQAAFGCS